MKIVEVEIAIMEAERFLDRAKDFKKALVADQYLYQSKEGGALRRASMDLTRALAKMRAS